MSTVPDFVQDEEETPVLFRIPKSKRLAAIDGVTAYFPAEIGTYDPATMSCYAHVGQHGSCSAIFWSRGTRRATPEEYASLKAELEGAPYGYRLKVCKRMTRAHVDARWAEYRRMSERKVA